MFTKTLLLALSLCFLQSECYSYNNLLCDGISDCGSFPVFHPPHLRDQISSGSYGSLAWIPPVGEACMHFNNPDANYTPGRNANMARCSIVSPGSNCLETKKGFIIVSERVSYVFDEVSGIGICYYFVCTSEVQGC
ncbi:MAG: hypothetical protein PHX74_00880 [Candidatus Sumerlaeales bacterium]|nr:hypothetical protein [Candidatus Sumerlaeales bacterium]